MHFFPEFESLTLINYPLCRVTPEHASILLEISYYCINFFFIPHSTYHIYDMVKDKTNAGRLLQQGLLGWQCLGGGTTVQNVTCRSVMRSEQPLLNERMSTRLTRIDFYNETAKLLIYGGLLRVWSELENTE